MEYYVFMYPKECKARIFRLEDGKYDKVGDFIEEVTELKGECPITIYFAKVCKKLRKLRQR